VFSCGENNFGQTLVGYNSLCISGFTKSTLACIQDKNITAVQCGKNVSLVQCDDVLYIVGKLTRRIVEESSTNENLVQSIHLAPLGRDISFVEKSNFVILVADRKIYGLGFNREGELGIPDQEKKDEFTRTFTTCTQEESLRKVEKIICGYHHSFLFLGGWIDEIEAMMRLLYKAQRSSSFIDVEIKT
jgi:alpha-tubulin suppressor-like RCC1 family protein